MRRRPQCHDLRRIDIGRRKRLPSIIPGEMNRMARYKEESCDGCGKLLPRNYLRSVSVNRKTGFSNYGATTLGRKNSTRVGHRAHYARKTFLLCGNCPDPKSEGGLPTKLILFLILLGAIGAGVFYLPKWLAVSGPRPAPSKVEKVSTRTDHPPQEDTRPGSVVEPSTLDEGEAIPPADTSSESVTPSPDENPAIQAAVLDALERGRTVRWRADGRGGYAVVSGPTQIGERVCRSVSVTIRQEGRDERGPDMNYCNSGQGWAREEN